MNPTPTDNVMWQGFWQEAMAMQGFPTEMAGGLHAFQALYQALVLQNQQVNLTRITSPEDFATRHALDALTLCRVLPQTPFTLADVGSGGGFPALPLAILYPQSTLTAIESTGKKARAIEAMAHTLGLNNLSVLAERAETLGQASATREAFDVVTARAVAPLNILAELCLPLAKPGGLLIAMKTSQAMETEGPTAQKAITTCGGTLEETLDVSTTNLPHRLLVVIRKTTPTPKAYPRKPGTPEKKPL